MTTRMMSTQHVNRRYEEKLHALEEQLNAQRLRLKMRLREDTQRLHNDLIHLRICTPSTPTDSTSGLARRVAQSAHPGVRRSDSVNPRPTLGVRARTDIGISRTNNDSHASEKSLLAVVSSHLQQNLDGSVSEAALAEHAALARVQDNVLIKLFGDDVKQSPRILRPVQDALPPVEQQGNVRFISNSPRQTVPTVEVKGSMVHLHYKHSHQVQTKTFLPDNRTRMLLLRFSRITDSLDKVAQRRALRFPPQPDGPEVSGDVHGTRHHREKHGTRARGDPSVQQRKKAASTKLGVGVIAVNTVATAKETLKSKPSRRQSSKVDSSGVSGRQLKEFYSLWDNSQQKPVWTSSHYRRRKRQEDKRHHHRSKKPKQHVKAAFMQAVTVLESGKKTKAEASGGGGTTGAAAAGNDGDGEGGGGVKAAAKVWMKSPGKIGPSEPLPVPVPSTSRPGSSSSSSSTSAAKVLVKSSRKIGMSEPLFIPLPSTSRPASSQASSACTQASEPAVNCHSEDLEVVNIGAENPEYEEPEFEIVDAVAPDPEILDPENPDAENFYPTNPEPEDPENLDSENLDPEDTIDPENPDHENPEDPEDLDSENLDPEDLDPENFDPEDPEDLENLDPANPEDENLDPENLDPGDPDLEDPDDPE